MFLLILLGLLGGCRNPERLNVLLISIDTLRPDHLSAYQGNRPTPAIDRVAARGVRFENAFSPSPWTLPAHASMLSGRYPSSIGDDPNALNLFEKTRLLSSILGDRGYETGGVTGGLYVGRKFGLAEGFDFFHHAGPNSDVSIAEKWLRDVSGDPFFLFFHTYVAHAPYEDRRYVERQSGGRLRRIYSGGRLNKPHYSVCCEGFDPTPAERKFVEDLYDGGVARADEDVRRLWEILGSLQLRQSTLVVITSDHGEEFWEHTGRAAYHGHTLYDELLRIPLIWLDPEKPGTGRVVSEPVSLIDIVPTLLARLGIDARTPVDGIDLAPLLEGGNWDEERVLFAEGSRNGPERKSVRSRDAKLIVTPHPSIQGGEGAQYPVPVLAPVELYAAADAGEHHNRAEQDLDAVETLMRHLAPRIERMPEDTKAGSLDGLDEETRRELRSLGYAQ